MVMGQGETSVKHIGRRGLVGAAATVAVLSGTAASWVVGSGFASDYDEAANATWRLSRAPGVARDLVAAATLAANSHNTQPWRFRLVEDCIAIRPDLTRRCPAVDPDDHHLFVSLGCAVENIVQAAVVAGMEAVPAFTRGGGGGVDIALHPGVPRASPLAEAIPLRQSTRAEFDGRPLTPGQLDLLTAAGQGYGVTSLMLTGRAAMETVLGAVIEGNTAQVNDPAFVAELRHWLRFSYSGALATRDGLFSGCTGNPVVPGIIGRGMFELFYTADGENKKYVAQVRSSAGIAVIACEVAGPAGWVAAGRAFQRFALRATAMGLKLSLLNNPIEVAAIRPSFATAVGLGMRRPDMVVRFGYGPTLRRSLRRPVEQVLA